MPLETFEIKLIERHEIAPNVMHLKFERTDATPFQYIAGQFITLHLNLPDHEKELKRSYSIAAAPGSSPYIEFTASYVEDGRATKILFNMPEENTLACSGPYGRLILENNTPKRYIFVATGTGVTPYRAMLPDLAKLLSNEDLEVELLFGCRQKADVLFEDEFLAFAAAHPNFNYSAHISREQDDLAAHQHTGYVQQRFQDLNLNAAEDIVYLCGNPMMIDEAFNQLKEAGFENKSVKREKYISK